MLDEIAGVRVGCPAASSRSSSSPSTARHDGRRGEPRLREHGIFGGKDLSRELPELGQSALYCVTEVHTQDDVDRLADALQEVLAS